MSSTLFLRVRRFLPVGLALAPIAACSGLQIPTADDLVPQTPKFEFKTLPTAPVRKLGPPALVGPDGSCSAVAAAPEFTGTGVALQMSECDVIQRVGTPQNIDIAANRRGERAVVMTYAGEHAGIYRFVSGRLVSIERGAEPPAPERPAKKRPARTSSRTSAQ